MSLRYITREAELWVKKAYDGTKERGDGRSRRPLRRKRFRRNNDLEKNARAKLDLSDLVRIVAVYTGAGWLPEVRRRGEHVAGG